MGIAVAAQRIACAQFLSRFCQKENGPAVLVPARLPCERLGEESFASRLAFLATLSKHAVLTHGDLSVRWGKHLAMDNAICVPALTMGRPKSHAVLPHCGPRKSQFGWTSGLQFAQRPHMKAQRIFTKPGNLRRRGFTCRQTRVPSCDTVVAFTGSLQRAAMTRGPKQDGLNTEYRAAFDELKAAVDALDTYLRRGSKRNGRAPASAASSGPYGAQVRKPKKYTAADPELAANARKAESQPTGDIKCEAHHASLGLGWTSLVALLIVSDQLHGTLPNKEIDMFNLAKVALHEASATGPSNGALTWTTPVRFDATLVVRLVDQHRQLHVRFAELVAEIERNRQTAGDAQFLACAMRDCANQLHDLRRAEALWLYPVIAREFATDPTARRLFWQARLIMLGLARGLARRFDELVRAIREGTETRAAADQVAKAFAEYRRRNEAQMYPLYDLMQLCDLPGSQTA